jgi:glycosyltransferase involved in cell wall biosynthesis
VPLKLEPSPQISVVIPAYNASAYIAETLDSVFAQSRAGFETIVVNDGSPDTLEFERALEPYRDKIVYLKQENRGPSAARNAGIRAARGELIAFLDSDDGWQPEYLAAQTEFLRQNPSLDLVYCDGIHVGEGELAGRNQMRGSPSRGAADFRALLTGECTVLTSLTLARTSAVLRAGLFDEAISYAEDYDLWLRMARQGSKIGYHPSILGWHRLRPDGLGSAVTRMLASAAGILARLENDRSLDPELRTLAGRQRSRFQSQFELEEGKRRLCAGDFQGASELLRRVNTDSANWRLRLTLLGLRVAPGLTASAARWLQPRSKARGESAEFPGRTRGGGR